MELSAMGTDFVEVVSGFIANYNLTSTSSLPALVMIHDVLGTFEQVIKEQRLPNDGGAQALLGSSA